MSDGTYCIHFSNKKALSKEEIGDMFTPYGDVLSITWKGDINSGLIFIKYGTLEETLHCLESLQKTKLVRILPQKDKISNHKVQRSSDERQEGKKDNSFHQPFTTDRQHTNSTYSSQTCAYEEKPTCNRKNSDYNNRFDYADNFSNSSSPQPKHDYKSNINAVKSNKLNPLVLNEKHSQYSKQQYGDYKVPHYNQITKQQESKFYRPSKLEANTYMNTDVSDNKIPSLISDPEIKPEELDSKLDHSLPTRTKNTSSKSVVIMQEVIVANIHKNYGVHYILHLFEKRSPISATFVKTIFKTDIRYCLVYFMNADDALAIEKEFDNFSLSGRNLIVLRKSQLNKVIC